ncbi:HAMP domain-containing sensor histidine kinase [Paenibacillus montanisoli]|uniref:histidine kinase n=1 Tax=Paenibacillus montanisoli TaxID=2081970 RepID=A0A328TX70_9BACL|nr:HAMP domain-containing sensor histidine kinase [Paenibacillus montanisoli]RAP73691.1 hypothetical protein DL346_25830 [Paenibacillus montanisoli]
MIIKSNKIIRVLLNYFLVIIPLTLFFLYVLYATLNIYLFSNINHTNNQSLDDKQLIDSLLEVAKNNPSEFFDHDYLVQLDESLKEANLHVGISHGSTIVYLTSNLYKDVSKNILFYPGSLGDNHVIKSNYRTYTMKSYPFQFDDGSEGTIFVINNHTFIMKLLLRYDPALILYIFIAIMILNGVLSIIISRKVIRPLKTLTDATIRVTNGDLDFSMKTSGKGEISVLANAFDDLRKRLKESMRKQLEMEEVRKWSLASFTHDFANPLMAAKGYIQGLLEGVANTPEKQKAYLDTIKVKIDETERLYRSFVLFYKLNLHQMTFKMNRIHIISYLHEFIQNYDTQLQLHNGKIELDVQAIANPFVYADEEHLKRVLNNILENSIKYCSNPIKIQINLSENENKIKILITDNGPGVKDDEIPYLFDRFFRAKHNKTVKGSGLGLSIASYTIKEMGGECGIISGRKNGFSIWFTLSQEKIESNEE